MVETAPVAQACSVDGRADDVRREEAALADWEAEGGRGVPVNSAPVPVHLDLTYLGLTWMNAGDMAARHMRFAPVSWPAS
jgi:hypothetical protein